MKKLFYLLLVPVIFAGGCTVKKSASVSVTPGGNVEKVRVEEESTSSKTIYDYQAVFRDKSLIATGVYRSPNETIALNMSLNMAINNLAKSAGEVIQKEDTTLYNDKVNMIIETKANNIVKGFKILSQDYDTQTGRAETTIKMAGEQLATMLVQEMKEYK